jgi:hypothetical protein
MSERQKPDGLPLATEIVWRAAGAWGVGRGGGSSSLSSQTRRNQGSSGGIGSTC